MPEPISLGETRRRLREDRRRLLELFARDGVPRPLILLWHPSYLCVWLHRASHFFARRGRLRLARVFWHANLLVTGVDITPASDLGGGLVIPNPASISVSGRAGRNLTLMALSGIGGELSRRDDVGAGPGLPLLGDDVVIAPHAGVLGPVRIGDGARLSPGCIVTRDVPAGAVVEPSGVRVGQGLGR